MLNQDRLLDPCFTLPSKAAREVIDRGWRLLEGPEQVHNRDGLGDPSLTRLLDHKRLKSKAWIRLKDQKWQKPAVEGVVKGVKTTKTVNIKIVVHAVSFKIEVSDKITTWHRP
jgi:hypothetical protein